MSREAVLEVSERRPDVSRSFDGIAFHAAVVTDVAAPLGFPPEVLVAKSPSQGQALFAKSCRGAWRSSMRTIPMPKFLAVLTWMCVESAFALSRPQRREESST